MIKLSKLSENELKCLCGLCEHDTYDRTCPYAQMLEASDPNLYLFNRVKKLMTKEFGKPKTKTRKTKSASTKTKSKRK